MRTASFIVFSVAFCAAFPAFVSAQDKPAKPAVKQAAKPAVAVPAQVAVPADVKARVVSQLKDVSPSDVSSSPVPGLYEVTMGGLIAYVSADGKYLVSGNIYDLESEVNLTAMRRNAARAKALASLR